MATKPVWSKVILIGDSLVQFSFNPDSGCWASMLANSLQRISDVVTRGFSGYTSRSIRNVLPDILSKDDYDQAACIILFIGVNDACDNTSIQHVPKDQTEDNLTAILAYLKEQGVPTSKIIMLTPTCFFFDEFQAIHDFKLPQRYPDEYSKIVRRVADKAGVEIVDTNKLSNEHPNPRSLFYDGIHLNRTGAELLYKAIWPSVVKRVTDFHGSFEIKLPIWEIKEKELQ
ncbi:isoamyl acetate-hydrolyzing esterase 1 homolog [Panonychus citri]|uniref:isoamyl acetate-hydrolyzing esterase 1 homolog n=1 Tax=Panonychus citri TaxID=50023 RepID=UPI0023079A9A|nr:isoamyl acetate-hydrolyzing esterase 1 homolog [Panonychus citri]